MTVTVDTSVRIGSLTLGNPVLTASGTFGSGREYKDFLDIGRLGAIVTKGVSPEPWEGNESPRIAETASGMLNSIGLQNPGVDAFIADDLAWLRERDATVIVNVSGHAAEDYAEVVRRIEAAGGADAYELNISCPNVDEGGMAFGVECEPAAAVTEISRRETARPLIVKLSPNVTDIVAIARSVEAAGADAVSLVNTVLGMAVDVETFRPRLARVVGGLSGPAIKPIALRMVWEVASAVQVPVIGMGGIMTATDAVEFMLVGATAIAVGTANFVDPTSTIRVLDGLVEFCRERDIGRVADLTGALQA